MVALEEEHLVTHDPTLTVMSDRRFQTIVMNRGRGTPHRVAMVHMTDPSVDNSKSWEETRAVWVELLDDTSLDLDVVGKLYKASRRAYFRTAADFMPRNFGDEIAVELKRSRVEALALVPKEFRPSHLHFVEQVIDRIIFYDGVPKVNSNIATLRPTPN